MLPGHTTYAEVSKKTKTKPTELKLPMTDVIHTDSVIVTFEKLSTKNSLPLNVQKKLVS